MTSRYHLVRAGLVVAFVSAPPAASSHPLGNFSIDHYSRLQVTPDALHVRYVLDLAEIPTIQEMWLIDADRDGEVSDHEKRAYLESKIRELAERLTTTLNGNPLEWRIESSELTVSSDARAAAAGADSTTLRIRVDLRAAFPRALSRQNTGIYTDANYPQRAGWKEVVVQPGPGVRLLKSSAPLVDRSRELTWYSPLEVVPPADLSAAFAFEVAATAGGGRSLVSRLHATLGDQAYVWMLAAAAAVGLFLRWRAGRRAGEADSEKQST